MEIGDHTDNPFLSDTRTPFLDQLCQPIFKHTVHADSR